MKSRTFPGNYKSLETISEFIIQEAQYFEFSPAEVYAIQTAVDEACANIIDHAYGGENLGQIEIQVQKLKEGIKIILHDNGVSFDPDDIPAPDITSPLEIREEGGLGIFFMQKLMDEVIFNFSQSGTNTLTMLKYRGD
ncbi:MAG: ATP-binding protein [Chloroflexota bacterium]|nr:ATP-binding protein [Chloroflexota bacterium]